VDTLTAPNQSPVSPLIRRGLEQTRKPEQRRGEFTAVRQYDNELVVRDRDVHGIRGKLDDRNGHSKPPGTPRDALSPSAKWGSIHVSENRAIRRGRRGPTKTSPPSHRAPHECGPVPFLQDYRRKSEILKGAGR